ncbi:PhzF family phenazine biosynthesis protein [Domibacillus sp. PGB-M46]|uniref:PhzF family phenazine biosynthesis protein n=1 Tax=Domibacillus sp. PGB-M46 TaxID=2910255 RepID=UPI001F59562E|nr:PhzF family phenazine biosynthesis protein [Domibacillus sp. PGB-M46]MCI2255216.1 PhzF family phenazine biosynthesis protein [Domibacillus sp. PGB-M46]
MKTIPYSIVDVFSQGKYTGNQLAVFKEAERVSTDEMQKIAKEINFSETTFILSNTETTDGYSVRIFTPNEEIPFAGHPTLGTAFVINKEMVKEPADSIVLQYKSGQIPVTFDHEKEIVWMKQNKPSFGKIIDADQIADILNIDPVYINVRFPVQEVSTGLPVIIVPVTSLHAIKNIHVNQEKYYQLIEQTEAKAILAFSPETYNAENHLNVRDFAPYYGIPEDAATGSANGCLAAYLVQYRYFDNEKIDIRVEQGYEIKRPSLLFLKARRHRTTIDIQVGGQVAHIAKGEWFLNQSEK